MSQCNKRIIKCYSQSSVIVVPLVTGTHSDYAITFKRLTSTYSYVWYFVCAFLGHSSQTLTVFLFEFAVHLEAPDTMLLERYAGKRIDSLTGGMHPSSWAIISLYKKCTIKEMDIIVYEFLIQPCIPELVNISFFVTLWFFSHSLSLSLSLSLFPTFSLPPFFPSSLPPPSLSLPLSPPLPPCPLPSLSSSDIYHLVFDPPKSADVADRLIEEPGGVEKNMHSKLSHYHRHSRDLLSSYRSVTKNFNADQPIRDLIVQSECAYPISHALPLTNWPALQHNTLPLRYVAITSINDLLSSSACLGWLRERFLTSDIDLALLCKAVRFQSLSDGDSFIEPISHSHTFDVKFFEVRTACCSRKESYVLIHK